MKLDTSAWKNDDKEWLKSRKEEWRQIQKNLKHMKGWLRGSYLKHHKALYFDGAIDDEVYRYVGGKEFGHSLPLFIMWYHPKKTRECYKKIFNEWIYASCGSLTNSRRLLFEFPGEEFTSDYGMLGGRESEIVSILNPSCDPSECMDKNKSGEAYQFCLDPSKLARYCIGGIQPHIAGFSINKHSPGQYLWECLSKNIQDLDGDHASLCKAFLQKILSYEFENNDSGSTGYQLARKLLDQYENRDLPEPMLVFWDEAKDELG